MYAIVETTHGKIRGQKKTSEYFSHKKYFSFQGIPYAKPPLGPLRFKDPEEPEAWSGVLDALTEGSDCSQNHMIRHTPIGSEDCLYLNVYTPQLNAEAGLSVMLWIHGGGFVTGSGSTEVHGPDYLIEHDVVLVTVNYRLGVLGFLCLDHEEVPGNAGLKDQAMSLKWVQKNIVNFGGDPNKVTIFGESAGAASVHYQLLSPLSQGLFQHAIMQSGSALNKWALLDRATLIDRAFRLGKALGCNTSDTNRLLEFLRNVPVEDFLTANSVLTDNETRSGLTMIFLPCVEVPATSRSFLTASPRELLKQGNFAKVPVIMGSTSAEGVISYAIFNLSEDNITKQYGNFEKSIIQGLGLSAGSEDAERISKKIKQFYFGNDAITMKNVDNFFELFGDVTFDYGIYESLRIHKKFALAYAYEFTQSLSSNHVKVTMEAMKPGAMYKGVCHAEDISFFFNNSYKGVKKPDSEDKDLIAKISKMWTTFAKTGSPNYNGMEVRWDPVKENSLCHLNIGRIFKLVPEAVKQQRMKMWQQLYDKTYNLH